MAIYTASGKRIRLTEAFKSQADNWLVRAVFDGGDMDGEPVWIDESADYERAKDLRADGGWPEIEAECERLYASARA